MDKELTDNSIDNTIDNAKNDVENVPAEPTDMGVLDVAGANSVDSAESTVVASPDAQESASDNTAEMAPGPETPESPAVDATEQMQNAVDAAEDHAKAVKELESAYAEPAAPTPDAAQPSQPVDVRQDFINQMNAPKPKKDTKIGQKVAILVAVILLLGIGGFFTWWFAYYNRPEIVVADAVNKIITSGDINTFTTVTPNKSMQNSGIESITISGQAHGLTEFSQRVDVSLGDPRDGEEEKTSLSAETMMLGDGILYFKLDGLDNFSTEYSDDLDDDTLELAVSSSSLLDEINGKWYQIDIDEVMQFFGVEKSTSQPIVDFYNCTMSVASQDYSEELKALYRGSPFLKVEKSEAPSAYAGTTVYDLGVDYEKLADFLNALPHLSMAESFYVCYNTMAESLGMSEISAENASEVDAEEVEKTFSNDQKVQVEIRNFGHELVRLSVLSDEEDDPSSVIVDFDYSHQELSAPESYWTAEDLVTTIQEYFMLFEQNITIDDGGHDYDFEYDYDDEDYDDNEWFDDEDWYFDEETI